MSIYTPGLPFGTDPDEPPEPPHEDLDEQDETADDEPRVVRVPDPEDEPS